MGAGRLAAWVLAAMLLAPAPAPAEAPPERSGRDRTVHTGRVGFDLLVLRPLQLVQVVASAAIFLPSYPVSFLFDGDEYVIDALLTEPANRLFRKPLGQL